MTDKSALKKIQTSLRQLNLEERDFSESGVVTDRLAAFKAAISSLELHSETWLTEWLADEHFMGSVLFAAAKTNWNHERLGKGSLQDRQMRAKIVSRFNAWVKQLDTRLSEDEEGLRDPQSVAEWRSELTLFREDPVSNM